jgi:hypothetical protein
MAEETYDKWSDMIISLDNLILKYKNKITKIRETFDYITDVEHDTLKFTYHKILSIIENSRKFIVKSRILDNSIKDQNIELETKKEVIETINIDLHVLYESMMKTYNESVNYLSVPVNDIIYEEIKISIASSDKLIKTIGKQIVSFIQQSIRIVGTERPSLDSDIEIIPNESISNFVSAPHSEYRTYILLDIETPSDSESDTELDEE